MFLLRNLGRRGEQNKLASQTHAMKIFLLQKNVIYGYDNSKPDQLQIGTHACAC